MKIDFVVINFVTAVLVFKEIEKNIFKKLVDSSGLLKTYNVNVCGSSCVNRNESASFFSSNINRLCCWRNLSRFRYLIPTKTVYCFLLLAAYKSWTNIIDLVRRKWLACVHGCTFLILFLHDLHFPIKAIGLTAFIYFRWNTKKCY